MKRRKAKSASLEFELRTQDRRDTANHFAQRSNHSYSFIVQKGLITEGTNKNKRKGGDDRLDQHQYMTGT